ncbi:MAG: acyltransferase [Deltaproteobacteria bacterium]|nr:acyltransferase [Deltaproteobacteria bacterium]
MRRDTRPYWVKKAMDRLNTAYCERFLRPQFDELGIDPVFRNPRHFEIIGPDIRAGDHLHALAARDAPISLVVYPETGGKIRIGSYVALSPGVRIKSATSIEVGDSCLIAERVFITDADWHDYYDRIYPPGPMAPVRLEENVWIGDGATICKGVTIGKNSVVGTGSIVTTDVPPNTVVAGNPARPIRTLDEGARFVTRREMFLGAKPWGSFEDEMSYRYLSENTLLDWFRAMFAPTRDM